MTSRTGRAGKALRVLHRWVGIGLFLLLILIGVSGALLVFDDDVSKLLYPQRYLVTGTAVIPPTNYLRQAAAALDRDLQPSIVRYPEQGGEPVTVTARGTSPMRESGPPRMIRVYLDPPTGRLLDTVDPRSSPLGVLHRFHENLTIPEYSGRAIVGWVGVAMLLLSLSGIYLWWPRNGVLVAGLRWRRASGVDANLHRLFGFWISLPLAVVSITGIYLSFPPQARSFMSAVAPMSPQGARPGFGPVAPQTALTADAALEAAAKSEPAARPLAIFLPIASREANRGEGESPSWRIQMRTVNDETVTLLVNDRTGDTARTPDPLPGDRAAQWIRWIHEGSHSGKVWRMIVFLTGIFPAVLGLTGMIMWLRGRRSRNAAVRSNSAPATETLQAAE
jgi:uncharacterized iron-regulated membrane protein